MKEYILHRESKSEPEIVNADFYKHDPHTGEIQFFRKSQKAFVTSIKGTDYIKMIEKDMETGKETILDPNNPEI
ncbi:MAG: hypothetical protein ACLFR2_12115 [Candidatus Kapaibacterium sp.]